MAKNPLGKSRSADNPYAVFENLRANWKWKVLKTYQLAKNEKQYARWYLATTSPHVYDELGDGYRSTIMDDPQTICTYASPEFLEAYGDDLRVLSMWFSRRIFNSTHQ